MTTTSLVPTSRTEEDEEHDNGPEEGTIGYSILQKFWEALETAPNDFYALVRACRDKNSAVKAQADSILKTTNLVDKDGSIHEATALAVEAYVLGDGLDTIIIYEKEGFDEDDDYVELEG
jgi:hypothetical protein